MYRFQSHRHFQGTGKQVPESQCFFAHEPWVRFNHDVVGERNCGGNGRVIRERNSGGVKKTAAVVELDVCRPRTELCEGVFNLPGNCPHRNRLRHGVLPQIAHQTTPGALLVREQDDGRINHAPETGPLLFQKEAMRLKGIDRRAARRSLRHNPGRRDRGIQN